MLICSGVGIKEVTKFNSNNQQMWAVSNSVPCARHLFSGLHDQAAHAKPEATAWLTTITTASQHLYGFRGLGG
jgi:hypothetical protein